MSHRAVFLDRDGTIDKEVDYLNSVDDLVLIPGAAEAIRMLNQNSIKVIIATNQAGIAKGYLSEKTVEEIHRELKRKLEEEGAFVDAIYYCPHHPDFGGVKYKVNCACRKPEPGMFKQAAAEHNLDLANSYSIGDKIDDLLAGKRVGGKTILVLTGYGNEEKQRLTTDNRPDYIADNLLSAVKWIIS